MTEAASLRPEGRRECISVTEPELKAAASRPAFLTPDPAVGSRPSRSAVRSIPHSGMGKPAAADRRSDAHGAGGGFSHAIK